MKPSQKTVKCIDWSRVIFDLEYRAGMSWSEMAAGCGFNHHRRGIPDDGGKRWLQRLKNIPGTQPDFHGGALLIGLWAEKMGRSINEIPRSDYHYVRNARGQIAALPLVDRMPGEPQEGVPIPGDGP